MKNMFYRQRHNESFKFLFHRNHQTIESSEQNLEGQKSEKIKSINKEIKAIDKSLKQQDKLSKKYEKAKKIVKKGPKKTLGIFPTKKRVERKKEFLETSLTNSEKYALERQKEKLEDLKNDIECAKTIKEFNKILCNDEVYQETCGKQKSLFTSLETGVDLEGLKVNTDSLKCFEGLSNSKILSIKLKNAENRYLLSKYIDSNSKLQNMYDNKDQASDNPVNAETKNCKPARSIFSPAKTIKMNEYCFSPLNSREKSQIKVAEYRQKLNELLMFLDQSKNVTSSDRNGNKIYKLIDNTEYTNRDGNKVSNTEIKITVKPDWTSIVEKNEKVGLGSNDTVLCDYTSKKNAGMFSYETDTAWFDKISDSPFQKFNINDSYLIDSGRGKKESSYFNLAIDELDKIKQVVINNNKNHESHLS